MSFTEKYLNQLLEQSQYIYRETPISGTTQQAYLATPRHHFVKRYRAWGTKEWHDVSESNLEEHAATLYDNRPLILYGDDDADVPSTISQPSFVLRMLDMLQLAPGQTVFELGAGSGWNAALMGHIVGPQGHVYSLEIIPEVAQRCTATIEGLEIDNVHIIQADGGAGYAPGAQYDRGIFTAGTYDLPRPFYEQIKNDGLLLVVIKNCAGGDNLFLLKKVDDHFESMESVPAGFVQMTGKYRVEDLEPICLETVPEWSTLQHLEVATRPFWWGGRGKESLMWRTVGISSFLSITEPLFQVFKTEASGSTSHLGQYFGLWDRENQSLVLAKDDMLISYGSLVAQDRLLADLEEWVKLGMPSAVSFQLKVYPSDASVQVKDNEWLTTRPESHFLWSLAI